MLPSTEQTPPRLMRLNEVAEVTGLSRATIYKYVADRQFGFPQQVQLGPNRTAWVRSEVESWIEARKAARDKVAEAA